MQIVQDRHLSGRMPPRAVGPEDKIPCPTVDILKLELERLAEALEPEETEDTWGKFEKALTRFAAVTRGGGHKHVDVYLQGVGLKGSGDRIVRCVSGSALIPRFHASLTVSFSVADVIRSRQIVWSGNRSFDINGTKTRQRIHDSDSSLRTSLDQAFSTTEQGLSTSG